MAEALTRLRRSVFHQYWWQLGWREKFDCEKRDRHQLQVTWSLCLSNFNLPRVHFLREDGGGFICLDYGNGNSDPAFSIGIEW